MLMPTIIEFSVGAVLIIALFNEEKVAKIERKIFAYFRRKTFRIIKGKNNQNSKISCV